MSIKYGRLWYDYQTSQFNGQNVVQLDDLVYSEGEFVNEIKNRYDEIKDTFKILMCHDLQISCSHTFPRSKKVLPLNITIYPHFFVFKRTRYNNIRDIKINLQLENKDFRICGKFLFDVDGCNFRHCKFQHQFTLACTPKLLQRKPKINTILVDSKKFMTHGLCKDLIKTGVCHNRSQCYHNHDLKPEYLDQNVLNYLRKYIDRGSETVQKQIETPEPIREKRIIEIDICEELPQKKIKPVFIDLL
jgi:hypothetical protein